MQTAELIQKVRKLEIRTRCNVDEVIGGAYRSVFKGRGIEFDEVREYTLDDDVRDIDWNVSARFGAPYVKKYVEERELSVLLLLDVSGSIDFGSVTSDELSAENDGTPGVRSKRDVAVECAALLALSAIRNHDKVGLTLFSDRIELFLPLRSSRKHGLRLLRELVGYERKSSGTDVVQMLRESCNILSKRSVIFLISDLRDSNPELETALRIANRRHDVVVLKVTDPAERSLERMPALNLIDAESEGETLYFPASHAVRNRFQEMSERRDAHDQTLCRRAGVDLIEVPTTEDPLHSLSAFFHRREKISRRGSAVAR